MRLRNALVAAVSSVVVTVGVAPPATAAAPQKAAPPPTTFAVGVMSFPLVDSARTTMRNGTYAGDSKRTIVTTVYYPAKGRATPLNVDGAKPAPRGGPFPLILFSHELGQDGRAYGALLHAWAQKGYVIAAPNYPLSSAEAPGGPTNADLAQQAFDARFVVDQVLDIDHLTRAFKIDPRRIGAAGHSLGALTTFGLVYGSCCRDSRVIAAVSLAGAATGFPGTYFEGVATPLLAIHGDDNQTVPIARSAEAYARAKAPKYFVTLHGSDDTTAFQKTTDPAGPLVAGLSLDFFDAYLKGRASGLFQLLRDGNVKDVATLQATPTPTP